MNLSIRIRKIIQYSLVVSTLMIQVIIVVFFYNEFINENKLSNISQQILESNRIKKLRNESKHHLFNAQIHLNLYLKTLEKKELELYFKSLKKVVNNLEKIGRFEEKFPLNFKYDQIKESELKRVENLIDSIHKITPSTKIKAIPFTFKGDNTSAPKIEIEQESKIISDSLKKKKLLSRVRDAFQGKTEVKKDTIYLITTINSSIDTSKIRENLDSSINSFNLSYKDELQKVQKTMNSLQTKNGKIQNVYESLITLSNKLLEIYSLTSDVLSLELDKQYQERFSQNNQIRKYSIFGLMILLFFVLIIVAYYTKMTFSYETELKSANEKIESNLKFKNRILGMLSHELRSPLKILKIFVNRIDKKTNDKEIEASLKSIRFTIDSILIQAGQILEFTNDKSQLSKIHPVKFNLKEEIETLLNIFEPYINSVDNTLHVNNELSSDIVVYSDKVKLHQLFINLLGNANKFTQNGKITVDINCVESTKYRYVMSVKIEDTGIGISENDINKVFEPYYKAIIAENIENLGVGLGLNLCKEIVDVFQGDIQIESKEGKGTSVNFKIVLEKE